MKHLSQQMIEMELRAPHLQRYRRELQVALRKPGLTTGERELFQSQLVRVGAPKVYDSSEPSQPGALDPGPMPPVVLELDLEAASFDSLSTIPHSRLYLYARQEGLEVDPGDTKAQVVKTILGSIQGENP